MPETYADVLKERDKLRWMKTELLQDNADLKDMVTELKAKVQGLRDACSETCPMVICVTKSLQEQVKNLNEYMNEVAEQDVAIHDKVVRLLEGDEEDES